MAEHNTKNGLVLLTNRSNEILPRINLKINQTSCAECGRRDDKESFYRTKDGEYVCHEVCLSMYLDRTETLKVD
jgi:recombinational DNA repair protein (RecF pathway)